MQKKDGEFDSPSLFLYFYSNSIYYLICFASLTINDCTIFNLILCQKPHLPDFIQQMRFCYFYMIDIKLMFKMSHSSKHHCDSVFVTFLNRIFITNRTTWLNNCCDSSRMSCFNTIIKWEECVRC